MKVQLHQVGHHGLRLLRQCAAWRPAPTDPTIVPLYARALRLRYLRVTPLFSVVLFEGLIGLAVVLGMAELVSWWGMVLIPAAGAAMVKINDVAAGVVGGAAPLPLATAGGSSVVLGRHAAPCDGAQARAFGAWKPLRSRNHSDSTVGTDPEDRPLPDHAERSADQPDETRSDLPEAETQDGNGTVYRSQSAQPKPKPKPQGETDQPKPESAGNAAAAPQSRKRPAGPHRGNAMINGRPARPVHDDENSNRFRGGLNQGRFD